MSTLMDQVTASVGQARGRVPRIAGVAVQRARLTVVPKRQSTARRAPFALLVGAMLAVGVAGLLAFNTNMQQSAFTASTLQVTASALQAREQSLEMTMQRLRAPQALAKRAKRLGMVQPPAPAFIELSNGRVLGVPTPAAPADAMQINPPNHAKPRDLAPHPKIVKVVVPRRAGSASGSTAAPGGKKRASTNHTSRHTRH